MTIAARPRRELTVDRAVNPQEVLAALAVRAR